MMKGNISALLFLSASTVAIGKRFFKIYYECTSIKLKSLEFNIYTKSDESSIYM